MIGLHPIKRDIRTFLVSNLNYKAGLLPDSFNRENNPFPPARKY